MKSLEQEMEAMMKKSKKNIKKTLPKATSTKKTKKAIATSKYVKKERKRLDPLKAGKKY